MTMLMSSGIYRSPSYQDRCRVLALRRPASMIGPARSGGARAMKRRTVSGGEVIRSPSRIESMPNMRNGLDGSTRRPTKRRQRAVAESGARTAVDAPRKTRTRTPGVRYSATQPADTADDHATPPTTSGSSVAVTKSASGTRTKFVAVAPPWKIRTRTPGVRYSATKPADTADDHATPPTTSGSSSVVVDVEATPTSSAVDRTSLPQPAPRSPQPAPQADSPVSRTSADFTCLQSPVNSSGVRIVIDSEDDDDDDDRDRPCSPTDVDDDANRHCRLPDGPATIAASGSASSITSGSGDDEDSSNAVVVFHCGPTDDADDDSAVVGSTSGYRSAMISGVAAEPPERDAGSDASGFHLLSDNLV